MAKKKNAITEIRTQEEWVNYPPKCPLRYGGRLN